MTCTHGYEENTIQAAEVQIGNRLPTPLRTFYSAWGRRKDLTQSNQAMVGPDELIVRSDAIIFCFENQAACAWAIRREDLAQTDPPVVVADAPPDWEWGKNDTLLNWKPSHAHVSDFLNTLTYHHALCGGAIHGGYTNIFRHQEYQDAWLEQHWRRTTVGPMVFGLVDDFSDKLPFYVRNGQALSWFFGCSVAVSKPEILDEIRQALQVTWIKQW